MTHKSKTFLGMLGLAALTMAAPATRAAAPPVPEHLLPQAIQIDHKETLEQLGRLASQQGPVGAQAAKVLVLLQAHMVKEQEYILPPLTLLPLLAEGKVTPDMAWALPMVDRVKAEREQLFNAHAEITDALNELVVVATAANNDEAKEFAETAAADSLTDMEIFEPTLLLIGDTLRSKLPAAH